MIREGAVEDVWTGGTVRLGADELIGGKPEVRITGIGFSEKCLQRVVDRHKDPAAARKAEAAAPVIQEAQRALPQPELRKQRDVGPDLTAIPPGALTVTIKQAQAALGLGRTKINELMNDGRLVRTNIDRAVRIEVASILALAAASPCA
jgi:hypothetical protein